MSTLKFDRGTYTIPVDSMDLNHLSKYVSSTGILPLWTKTRLNGDAGYCQVQILAQNDEECYSEPTDTYECHICNVHVPVKCSNEHNKANQHITCTKIHQKLLENISRQIDVNIVKHDEIIDKDAYYCVPCSKIIKKENKEKHESSEFHAKSNKDTIIISEFYKIINEDRTPANDIIVIKERLSQDSDLEPVNSKNNNYATTINKLNNYYLDNGNDDLPTYANKLTTTGLSKNDKKIQPPNIAIPGPSKNDNKKQSPNDAIPGPSKNDNKKQSPNDAIPGPSKNDNRKQSPNDAIPGPSKNDNKIQPQNDEKAETFKEYLEAMIKKYKLKVNLPVMSYEDIYLESSNGQTVIVSPEHFQSYKLSKNSIYCQLCKMWISQDTRPHDVTETHVRNIFKAVNEKFARTIDSVSSHCVPCNYVVLTDSAQHTLDDNHRKIIKDTRVQKVGKSYCEDCNLYVEAHNFSVHIISKKHWKNFMKKHSICKTENPNVFFCKVCQLTVSKNGVKNHVVAKTHLIKKTNNEASKIKNKNTKKAKVNDKNTGSSTTSKNINNSEYCETCKVIVPLCGMEIHVDGKKHKQQIIELNQNDIKSNENKAQNSSSSSTNTSITNVDSLASTSTSISISNAGIKTDLSDANIEEYSELLEIADNFVRCKICMVYIAFVDSLIIEHMESKIHIENATKQKLGEYYKFLSYTDDTKTIVNCEICYVNIPKVDRNIIEHMEGRNHEIALTGLLEFHLITKEESPLYHCGCCEVDIIRYLEHINSKLHWITFLQKHKMDKTEMKKYVYESDINDVVARRHRVQYINLLKHNGIYKLDDTNYYCGTCQIKLGRISELDHVLGERHALKLAEIEDP